MSEAILAASAAARPDPVEQIVADWGLGSLEADDDRWATSVVDRSSTSSGSLHWRRRRGATCRW